MLKFVQIACILAASASANKNNIVFPTGVYDMKHRQVEDGFTQVGFDAKY